MSSVLGKSKVVVDFGSTYFTIFSEGRLLLRKPSAVILKKSLRPCLISAGEEAVKRMYDVTGEELFIFPIRKGAVVHREGCVLMIHEYLRLACGKRPLSLCVLVGCGLSPEQRLDIEKVFLQAGFTDIFLMESLWGLKPSCERFGIKAGLIIGGENTEIGIFEGGKPVIAYSLDVGGATINARIKDFVRDNYKIVISEESAERLKRDAASLYEDDTTKIFVSGKDVLTGRIKKIGIGAKELYPEAVYVFARILKVLSACLISAPAETVQSVEKTGILIAGYGSLFSGVSDYFASNLEVPVYVARVEDRLPFVGAEILASDESFVADYLNLRKSTERPSV